MNVFSGKGWTNLWNMLENFKNTPAGNEIVNKFLWDKQKDTDKQQNQAINKIIKHIKKKDNK
jgi:hypothetical protein